MRYDGTNFQGYNGTSWVNLDALDESQAYALTSTLSVAGTTTLSNTSNTGTLDVDGATTLSNASITGTLSGTGGYLTVGDQLQLGGNLNLTSGGWIYTTGLISSGGGTDTIAGSQAINITGQITTTGAITGGSLAITNTTSFTGNAALQNSAKLLVRDSGYGEIYNDGGSYPNSIMHIDSGSNGAGLQINNVTNKAITLGGATTCGSTLAVTGTSTFTDGVTLSSGATFNSTCTFNATDCRWVANGLTWKAENNAANGDLDFTYEATKMCYMDNGGSNNKLLNFTGQHRTLFNEDNIEKLNSIQDYIGLIVKSTGTYIEEKHVSEALPHIELTDTDMDKAVFGVVSDGEDPNQTERTYGWGVFNTVVQKTNDDDNRVYVNSVGEGCVWVCDKSGNIDNGDYITSSTVTGYGQKQNDDILHNYTVGKTTQSIDFSDMSGETSVRYLDENANEITESEYNTKISNSETAYRAVLAGVTFHCG